MSEEEVQKEQLEAWWREAGFRGLYSAFESELSDDKLFWLLNLMTKFGAGPFRLEQIVEAFDDSVTDGGREALFSFFREKRLLEQDPSTGGLDVLARWTSYAKERALQARPLPDGWKSGDPDPCADGEDILLSGAFT
ncbi:MAG: hypothetical protein KBD16_00315 [Candidatus Pacebacteria bacterium]|nr:hypothetical protein [Candidatus Paceibacterota bacterium]